MIKLHYLFVGVVCSVLLTIQVSAATMTASDLTNVQTWCTNKNGQFTILGSTNAAVGAQCILSYPPTDGKQEAAVRTTCTTSNVARIALIGATGTGRIACLLYP